MTWRWKLTCALACVALGLSLPAEAQRPAPTPRIGFLGMDSRMQAEWLAEFRDGLRALGFEEGRTIGIEYRWAEGRFERLPELAAELVAIKVDVIVTAAPPSVRAAQRATSTIPIVITTGADPVESGLVASLARPGGNLTGVTNLNVELWQKRVELIAELVPQARVIGLLQNPNNAGAGGSAASAQQAARAKGLQLEILKAGTEAEIDAAFATAVQQNIGALIVGDPLFDSLSKQVVALAAHHHVPTIYIWRKYVSDGGLISYGAIFTEAYHHVGIYAGKILSGAKPADLPVQQSTNFELVVNLKTAEGLGLTIPPQILARADEVIE